MFTMDSTEGYTQNQLDALNAELEIRLAGIEPHSDEWYRIEQEFANEVAAR
jgi:hypothetical protein